MSNSNDIEIPRYEEFCEGCREYNKYAGRDPYYQVATTHVLDHWGNFENMANAVGILLLNWNKKFYKFGPLDFNKLENCIKNNFVTIENFKNRDIFSLSECDEQNIMKLFNVLLEASMIDSPNKKAKSSVSAAKALHILVPRFFPPWDRNIADGYNLNYEDDMPEKRYIRYISFCKKMKRIAEKVKDYEIDPDKNIIKLIDEYNYHKFTMKTFS